MLIRFWGTRGSIPTPDRRTTFFGGNTSCTEIRLRDGSVVLLDCGTGARPLGLDLISRANTLPPIYILFTHTHWDHIQGFPFFVPAYIPDSRLVIYGTRGLERTLEESLTGQMQHTYFPVQLGELRAAIQFEEIGEERFHIGPYRVTTQFLNHTAPTIAYRLETSDLKVVYATDHEPFLWALSRPRSPNRFEHPGDERHVEFVAGADLLIHDAQYIDREYPAKRGWGHSTIEFVTDLAVRAGVKRLALFHHDPLHPDVWIRQQVERARRRARIQGSALQILAAAEGLEIDLPDPVLVGEARVKEDAKEQQAPNPSGRVLLSGSYKEGVKEVCRVLALDGHPLRTASTADLPEVMRKVRPEMVILVGSEREATLLDLAERVRAQKGGEKVPILILAGAEGPGVSGRLIDARTDLLSYPFNPAMLRARVRAWLGRRVGTPKESRPSPRKPRRIEAPSFSGTGLLKVLQPHERAALLAGAMACRFRSGQTIFKQGEPAGGLYFLRSGRVEVSIRLPDGREQVLTVLKAGEPVGELGALDGGPRTATAKATQPTTADYIPQEAFEAGLLAAPRAAGHLLRLMARRLRQTDRLVGELAASDNPEAPTESRIHL